MKRWLNHEPASNLVAESIRQNKPLSITCPSCDSSYFEEIKCNRYSSAHNVAPGQPVPFTSGAGEQYRILRCIKCLELLEPKVTRPLGHRLSKPEGSYSHFLESMTLEKKKPAKEMAKKEPSKKTALKKEKNADKK